jgi:hypothetical protein
VSKPSDIACRFQPVESAGHCSGGQVEQLAQFGRGPFVGLPRSAQVAQNLVVPASDPQVVERRGKGQVQLSLELRRGGEDPLGPGVEFGSHSRPVPDQVRDRGAA